jgi:hypothetical protein
VLKALGLFFIGGSLLAGRAKSLPNDGMDAKQLDNRSALVEHAWFGRAVP